MAVKKKKAGIRSTNIVGTKGISMKCPRCIMMKNINTNLRIIKAINLRYRFWFSMGQKI